MTDIDMVFKYEVCPSVLSLAPYSGTKARCSEQYLRYLASTYEWALMPAHEMRNWSAREVSSSDANRARLLVCGMTGIAAASGGLGRDEGDALPPRREGSVGRPRRNGGIKRTPRD